VNDRIQSDQGQAEPRSHTWKLTLAYDGTDFHGWQVQPGKPTIQGELQAALGRVTGETPLPQGSGRTDAGVHALGQVASFPLHAPIPPENLLLALNRTLPPPIRILAAEIAQDPAFHARHSTIAKTYEYRILRAEKCSPFLTRYVYTFSWPMNLDALHQAAHIFLGEHDFRSFAASDPDQASRTAENDTEPIPRVKAFAAPTVRTIFASKWHEQDTEEGRLLVYRVRGNGFLHHMVRNLVGTMLDVGRGRLRVDEIDGILAARSRSEAGSTAPGRGLFLHSVEY
jgi:tRNA pseudouridine38-40 synthase